VLHQRGVPHALDTHPVTISITEKYTTNQTRSRLTTGVNSEY